MKFTVSMKCPDALHDAIQEAVKFELESMALDEEEVDALSDIRQAKTKELCGRWFEYDEYLRVLVDTDAETCTVLPAK